MIIESDKRKESELKGRLIPVNPMGKQKVWPGGIFSVNCCPQAFNPKSTCKLVLCMGCNDEQGGKADTNTQGNKRRRSRGNDNAARKTHLITTGGERKSNCPNHLKEGLLNLRQETNKEYLKDNRKKKEERKSSNIATHCVYCGIRL